MEPINRYEKLLQHHGQPSEGASESTLCLFAPFFVRRMASEREEIERERERQRKGEGQTEKPRNSYNNSALRFPQTDVRCHTVKRFKPRIVYAVNVGWLAQNMYVALR